MFLEEQEDYHVSQVSLHYDPGPGMGFHELTTFRVTCDDVAVTEHDIVDVGVPTHVTVEHGRSMAYGADAVFEELRARGWEVEVRDEERQAKTTCPRCVAAREHEAHGPGVYS